MSLANVFTPDAFTMVSLTAAVNKMPHKPARIGQLGLFREDGITTTTVVIEEHEGTLALIESTPRGGPAKTLAVDKRKARSFLVPHFAKESLVLPDQVQNVRAFGSENATEGVQAVINKRLAKLRAEHEVTLEYMRMGAIKGQIIDGDGSTVLFNLFTEFGVSQQVHEIDLNNSSAHIREDCVEIQRLSENELGAEVVTSYRAFCGDEFFDRFIEHDAVKETLKYQEGKTLREDLRKGFVFGGITWENYRGNVGGTAFIPDGDAYVVPEGTSIFQTSFAPADTMEAVNTVGLPIYAMIAVDPEFGRWAKVHTQSNPLTMCTRPRAVIRVTQGS